jgi:hypothetical protein
VGLHILNPELESHQTDIWKRRQVLYMLCHALVFLALVNIKNHSLMPDALTVQFHAAMPDRISHTAVTTASINYAQEWVIDCAVLEV